MRLWFHRDWAATPQPWQVNLLCCPQITGSLVLGLLFLFTNNSSSIAFDAFNPVPTQQTKRSSPYVGSAMALLATLQDANVLPPEGTREADRVIQAVIQFQSVFAKSTDRSVQDFTSHAVAAKHGESAPIVLEQFRSRGWTSDMLTALSEAERASPVEDLQLLAAGFGQFNLSVEAFTQFMRLVRDGQQSLAARGQSFEEIYAQHRKSMPGGTGR